MPDITVTLSEDEAIILFEFLARFTEKDLLGIEDQSEQRVLWNLHCLLERQLVPIFDSQFRERLSAARNLLRDDEGTDAGGASELSS